MQMVGDNDADLGYKIIELTIPDKQLEFSYCLVAEYQIWKQKQPEHHEASL